MELDANTRNGKETQSTTRRLGKLLFSRISQESKAANKLLCTRKVDEASTEKEFLMTQLREMLEQMGRKTLLEADKDEAQHLQDKLGKVPIPIFIG